MQYSQGSSITPKTKTSFHPGILFHGLCSSCTICQKFLIRHVINLTPYYNFSLQFKVVLEDTHDVAVKHTHHFVLWRCLVPPGGNIRATFEPLVPYQGEECYFNDHNIIPINLCRTMIYAWGLGGKVRKYKCILLNYEYYNQHNNFNKFTPLYFS